MTNEKGYSLKDYRTAIRERWLPLVGRKQLKSYEFELCKQWFDESLPISLILKAINCVAERGVAVRSLGVIVSDLERLKREHARMHVGAHTPSSNDWKAEWDGMLAELAEGANNPELAAICNELRRDLPKLTRAQADARWIEIKRAYL
ncbi:MAG: hypothetical protein WBV94_07365 [Blastocatellia bacterium]